MTQSIPVRNNHALIIVDLQNDFCPGGSLPVVDGDAIVPVVNAMAPLFQHVVLTRDWHPADHCSFSPKPTFTDGSWPAHCVAGTHGAEFHKDLFLPENAVIVNKADNQDMEAYSGFQGTDLADWLRLRQIEMVYVCGLATDYCVRFTVMDAIRNKFRVRVIEDAVKGINTPDGSVRQAFEAMVKAGAEVVTSSQLLK